MARASDLLAIARAELGVRESPANSNNVKYNTAYYGREVHDTATETYAWCMVFIWWLFQRAKAPELFYGGGKTASCGALMAYAQAHGQWVTSSYQPGDIVILDIPGNKVKTDHCGIVVTPVVSGVRTIEGNTGAGNNANGGEVMERPRPASWILGAYRPHYEEEDAMLDIESLTKEQLLRLAERMQAALAQRPISAVLAPELEEAVALGITDGSNPNAFCTRAQAAVMVKRAARE